MEFSRKQINELITGVLLSAELPPSSPGLRHFVSVRGYTETERGIGLPDKTLNEDKRHALRFWLRDYEVPEAYLAADCEIPDGEIVNDVFLTGIAGVETLQRELETHLSDLSLLIPHWETDAPLG